MARKYIPVSIWPLVHPLIGLCDPARSTTQLSVLGPDNPARLSPSLPLLILRYVVAVVISHRRHRAVRGAGMSRDNWLSEILRLSKGGTVDPPSGELYPRRLYQCVRGLTHVIEQHFSSF